MLKPGTETITPRYNIELSKALNKEAGEVKDPTSNNPTFMGRFITRIEGCFKKETLDQVYQDSKNVKSVSDKDYDFSKEMGFERFEISKCPIQSCESVYVFGSTSTYMIHGSNVSETSLRAPYVKFDSSCKIANQDEVTDELNRLKATESMSDFICSNMEKMATLGGWSLQEVPMVANITKYTLTSDNPGIVDLPLSSSQAPLTMTTVISPCKQGDSEYSGGDLLFAEKAPQKTWFSYFSSIAAHILGKKHIPETIKQYPYPKNGCIVTDEVYSMAAVGNTQLERGESCVRIVVNVGACPNKKQYLSFLERNSGQNLVKKDSPDIS
ncbi:hypothetical protein [Endozoicomonas sp. ONNA2]|uniref:hypothetical protein n=1 Tax=Endozoicomonas sp. ONNA2 TaxID=2828741 RepID=UPI002147DF72|nr:hypothetical protein [Endozoicomonas sp. ONNA2]